MKRTVEQLKKDFPDLWKLMEKARTNNLVFKGSDLSFKTPNQRLKRWKEGYDLDAPVKLVSKAGAIRQLKTIRAEYQGWVREVDNQIKKIEQL